MESRQGEAPLQPVTFQCLGGGMNWCVSFLLCLSAALLMLKSHSGMGQFVMKHTGSHATIQLHENESLVCICDMHQRITLIHWGILCM